MVVLAFLQTLAMSPAQLEFSRRFRRALRKSMKKTPPDERLLAAMSLAFTGVSVDDWGPEYPFIEEDEESDDANS
jgi:L-rhamnose isomerase